MEKLEKGKNPTNKNREKKESRSSELIVQRAHFVHLQTHFCARRLTFCIFPSPKREQAKRSCEKFTFFI
jgi:hypothetical protein